MNRGDRAMNVAIAGGGTAGHVFPGLALGRTLRERGHDVTFLGTATGLEATLVPAAGFPFEVIRAEPLARRVSLSAARAPWVALGAIRRCRSLLRAADVVVGMGGYVSVPAVVAARRNGIPVILHEQNAVPGLANRELSRMARVVALSFAAAERFFPRRVRTVMTGNPVRDSIRRVPQERSSLAQEARTQWDLRPKRKTVVVFGGSQGAARIDRAAVGACRMLQDRSDLQMVLITGPAHYAGVQQALDRAGSVPAGGEQDTWSSLRGELASDRPGLLVRVFDFLERMELAYASADFAVCRAGATTIAELTVCGLPSLLIPYPHATRGHQEANARAAERAGAAEVLLDADVSPQALAQRLDGAVNDAARLRAMRAGAEAFANPGAACSLADLVQGLGNGGGSS